MRPAWSAPHELRNDLLRHRRRFQPRRIVRVTSDQHTGFERLDRQRLALEYLVDDFKARALEALDPAFDRDPVAMGRGDVKFRPRVHHRNADQAIFPDDVLLGKTSGLEQDRGRIVEHLEIARVIDDVGGVAVAPLDLHIPAVDEHAIPQRGAMRSEASSRTTSPFRYGLSIMCSASEANSSACPSRRGNGIDAARLSCASCGRLANSGVRNNPGAMVSTRMPNCASSRAIGSVIATMPPFEAE